jgi:hypothetical protein
MRRVLRAATSGYWPAAERTVAFRQTEVLARHRAGAGMSAQAVEHWLEAIKRAEARAQYSEVFA